jgi:hypothetical protein
VLGEGRTPVDITRIKRVPAGMALREEVAAHPRFKSQLERRSLNDESVK